MVTHKRFINNWCQPLMNKSSRKKKTLIFKIFFILFLVFFLCSDSYTVFQPLLLLNFPLMDYNFYYNQKQTHSCTHLLLTRAHMHSSFALFDMGIHGVNPWFYTVLAEDTWGERRSLFMYGHSGSPSPWDTEALDWDKTVMKAQQNTNGRFTRNDRREKQWNKRQRRWCPHFYSM